MDAGTRNTIIMFAAVALAGAGWVGYVQFKPSEAELRAAAQARLVEACMTVVERHVPTPASLTLDRSTADLQTGAAYVIYDRQNLLGAVIRAAAECHFRPAVEGRLELLRAQVEGLSLDDEMLEIWNLLDAGEAAEIWSERL